MQKPAYIGSKKQLLPWLKEGILEQTKWDSFSGKYIADLFSGSGSVTYDLREEGASVMANDTEMFSYVLGTAAATGLYTVEAEGIIRDLNAKLAFAGREGYMTRNYSPVGGRMFWTQENAMKIDFVREAIEAYEKEECYHFLLASLLQSADKVANCPGIYTAWFKRFEKKALKDFQLIPVHTNRVQPGRFSGATNQDALEVELPEELDAVYADPPYNKRQYSKHYFPLNVLALPLIGQAALPPLTGKTGIPANCYKSAFSSAASSGPKQALTELLIRVKQRGIKWLFLSFSSQSTLSKAQITQMCKEHGQLTHVYKQQHKRYKVRHGGGQLTEYLFCINFPSGQEEIKS